MPDQESAETAKDSDFPEHIQKAIQAVRHRLDLSPEMKASLEEAFGFLGEDAKVIARKGPRTRPIMAGLLVNHARLHLATIEEELARNAAEFHISYEADILYKHLFEDLMSALDYMACELWVRFCGGAEDDPRIEGIGFPYPRPGEDSPTFVHKISSQLPQLPRTRPDICQKLINYATVPFEEGPLLFRLSRALNQMKHRNFVNRNLGVTYTRESMRQVGGVWVAVNPTGHFDTATTDGVPRTLVMTNLTSLAEQSEKLVSRIVSELTGLLGEDSKALPSSIG